MHILSQPIIRRFLLVSALALALPVGNALAQTTLDGAMRHTGHGMDGGLHRQHAALFHRLDLSLEQQKLLRLLHDNQQDTIRPIMRSLREERIALRELVRSDSYDIKRAGEISEKIGHLHGQLALAMAEGHRKMLAVLTPEQRVRAKDFPVERSEKP